MSKNNCKVCGASLESSGSHHDEFQGKGIVCGFCAILYELQKLRKAMEEK